MSLTFNIQNYKCFKSLSISLGKITILAGSNSVGKSSVIQGLLLLRNAWETKRDNFLPLIGPFLLNLGGVKEILWKDANDIDEIKFILKYGKSNNPAFTTLKVDRSQNEPMIQDVNIPGEYPVGKNTFYYLNAERIGPRMNYQYYSQKFPNTGYRGEATFQLLLTKIKHMIDEKRVFHKTEDESRLFLQQVKYWLEYIIPGADFENALEIGRSKEIEASINENLPTNVGFGISYALPIIVNGLIAKEGSMFIVENPEAHLHPSGQSRIGKFLARMAASGLQVVVETHSEHVINGVRIAVLEDELPHTDAVINFFQTNEKKQVEVIEIGLNTEADLTAFPKGFFDQTQQDLARIIQLKRGKR